MYMASIHSLWRPSITEILKIDNKEIKYLVGKQAKVINRYFREEQIQITNTYMEIS